MHVVHRPQVAGHEGDLPPVGHDHGVTAPAGHGAEGGALAALFVIPCVGVEQRGDAGLERSGDAAGGDAFRQLVRAAFAGVVHEPLLEGQIGAVAPGQAEPGGRRRDRQLAQQLHVVVSQFLARKHRRAPDPRRARIRRRAGEHAVHRGRGAAEAEGGLAAGEAVGKEGFDLRGGGCHGESQVVASGSGAGAAPVVMGVWIRTRWPARIPAQKAAGIRGAGQSSGSSSAVANASGTSGAGAWQARS